MTSRVVRYSGIRVKMKSIRHLAIITTYATCYPEFISGSQLEWKILTCQFCNRYPRRDSRITEQE